MDARARTRVYVDAQVKESFEKRLDFGTESTYSGVPGPALVDRAVQADYRVEGIYLGTEDPSINVERMHHRVIAFTGHRVDASRIPRRWKYSLSNLRKTAERFDQLRIFDNSEHSELRLPRLAEQCRLCEGRWSGRRKSRCRGVRTGWKRRAHACSQAVAAAVQ